MMQKETWVDSVDAQRGGARDKILDEAYWQSALPPLNDECMGPDFIDLVAARPVAKPDCSDSLDECREQIARGIHTSQRKESDCNEMFWSGWLVKKSTGPLSRWKRRWFHFLIPKQSSKRHSMNHGGVNSETQSDPLLLSYCSDDRGRDSKQYRVVDFQHEPRQDTISRSAVTLTLIPLDHGTMHGSSFRKSGKPKRITIALEQNLDAVALGGMILVSQHPEMADNVQHAVDIGLHFPALGLERILGLKDKIQN